MQGTQLVRVVVIARIFMLVFVRAMIVSGRGTEYLNLIGMFDWKFGLTQERGPPGFTREFNRSLSILQGLCR